MPAKGNRFKIAIGLVISAVFLYLAFRKVDFGQMWDTFKTANYVYFIPAIGVIFLSHYLRAFRWRFLLDPVKRVDTFSLFSALIIGYMANVFMPAHLGEFLRAYVLSRKRQLAMSTTFATIVIERIIDVFSLLVLMVVTILVYPFPAWVTKSGYIMFAATVGLFVFVVLLKRNTEAVLRVLRFCLKPFPDRWEQKLEEVLLTFVGGVVPLKRRMDYVTVSVLSLLIWACYGGAFFFSFYAFDFVATYHLPWTASLVLLVITTVSIVVPSSPGYVGTYHYLCQVALGMFSVPAGPALSFAIAVHAINFLPVFIVGLFFARHEGMAISRMSEAREAQETLG
jgi:uncharacterized protein (TIRG00374 family)